MFIKIDLKEDRRTVAGILAVNGYQVTPAQRKKKKGSGNEYGFNVTETQAEAEEAEEEDDE